MEPPEEGQILQDDTTFPGEYYDPAYEWPGDEGIGHEERFADPQTDSSPSPQALRPGQPVFRLVVLRSSILPTKQKVAILDTYTEVQLGRDAQLQGSVTPRIRLKEMEVSKLHATAYWDGARKEWNVVDMGSKHGTFLHAGPVNPDSADVGTRLSQPRTASIPRRLRHSDQVTIGSTTLLVHIHDDQRPCKDCTISGKEGIPLFPSPRKVAIKRTRYLAGLDSDPSASSKTLSVERDPKKALNVLKRSLLTRHDSPKGGSSSTVPVAKSNEYIDRAARRRFLHPSSRPDSPGVPSTSSIVATNTGSPFSVFEESLPKPVISQPPPTVTVYQCRSSSSYAAGLDTWKCAGCTAGSFGRSNWTS